MIVYPKQEDKMIKDYDMFASSGLGGLFDEIFGKEWYNKDKTVETPKEGKVVDFAKEKKLRRLND